MDGFTFAASVLKFISDVISALAWPGVAIAGVWFFRREITPLVGKLSSLKLGSVEARFALDTEKALSDIAAAPAPQLPLSDTVPIGAHETVRLPFGEDRPPDRSDVSEQLGADEQQRERGLSVDYGTPSTVRNSAVVAMAWRDVEFAIDKLAAALGRRIEVPNKLGGSAQKIDAIARIGVLSPRFVQALRSLQHLRNEVLHTPGFEPSDESTKTYLAGVRSARLVLKDATLDARKWSTEVTNPATFKNG